MKRRKRPLLLMLALCIALVAAWLSRAGFIHMSRTEPKAELGSGELSYSITHRNRYDDPGVVKFDRSIQFTFQGDSTISPGSLEQMTSYMHRCETEIATQLARDIKFPVGP